MKALAITLEVVPVKQRQRVPDDERTVLIFNERWSDPCCFGYRDAGTWRSAEGWTLSKAAGSLDPDLLPPTHWAEVPSLADAVAVLRRADGQLSTP